MSGKDQCETVLKNSGLEKAVSFAKQSMEVYKSCILRSRKRGFREPHHLSIPEYREKAIRSYKEFRMFYFQNR